MKMERTRRKGKEENIKTKHLDIYFASSVFLTLAPGTGGGVSEMRQWWGPPVGIPCCPTGQPSPSSLQWSQNFPYEDTVTLLSELATVRAANGRAGNRANVV